MRIKLIYFLTIPALFLSIAFIADQYESSNIEISKLIKVNVQPSYMSGAMALDCAASGPSYSIHEDKYIDVYVDSSAYKEFMTRKKPNFKKGTVIVKKKYKNYLKDKSDVELYTAMIKINYTKTPNISNWEFQMLDKNLNKMPNTDTKKCVKCHLAYVTTDFVTRENYFPYKLKKKLK